MLLITEVTRKCGHVEKVTIDTTGVNGKSWRDYIEDVLKEEEQKQCQECLTQESMEYVDISFSDGTPAENGYIYVRMKPYEWRSFKRASWVWAIVVVYVFMLVLRGCWTGW